MKRMSTVLREMMASPGLIDSPGVHDPVSARIAEQLGFRCLDLSGFSLAAAWCVPEPLLSLEDVAEATRRITAAVNIPLVVDVGAGFGEPAHVVHTVRTFENAGAAGFHIEDQIYPKRFHYHAGTEHLIPAEAMVEKIRYAAEARRDHDFVIVARTDAFRTSGYAEAVRRANLYAQAGADFIMLFPNSLEEAKRCPNEIQAPLNYANSEGNRFGKPVLSHRELEEMGYKMVNYAPGPIFMAYEAMKRMLTNVKRTGKSGMDPATYTPLREELEQLIGLPEYYKIEKETTEKQ
jgi:methylisocitrate lyase